MHQNAVGQIRGQAHTMRGEMFRQDGAGMKPWEPPWVANLTPDAIVPLRPGMLFSIEPCPLRNVRDPGAPPHPV